MSDFTITVIDSENVIESTTTTVEIISVGMQGPSGPKGDPGDFDASIIVDMQNQVDNLESEVGLVRTLAQANDLKIGTKADQADLDVTDQQVEQNRLAILTKADIQALAQLALLVDTKADQSYVNQQIANLVGSAPEALNTVYELATAIQNEQGLIDSLNQSMANRVRFDIAAQALTEIQKQNARTNIDAEKLGTAQQLVSQITVQSIGAATAAQGAKADTALQSADVAPVALSGLFSSLGGQNKIFDVVFNTYALGTNAAITATDTLGQMLGNLQAQINNIATPTWVSADSIGTTHPSFINVQFAKINGLLWIRGYCNNDARMSAGTTLFLLTNPSYDLDIPTTFATPIVLGDVKSFNLNLDKNFIHLKNVPNNANKFSLHNSTTFTANEYNQIQPVALGRLLAP